ncbi:MAG TPA: hypothetical protein VMW46_05655 [Candidatus Desulfaltia sp.]|nr:hypothetical protein [Candidatus Desulfaltia sp.]
MRKKIGLAAAGVLFLGLTSYSQVVSFSLSSGLFFPKEEIYRDIYGQSMPLVLEVRIGISRYFGLAAGIEYLSDKGPAMNVNQGDTEFPLRFRMISYPVSGYFLYPLGKISLSIGAGISFHSYKEEWEDLDLDHEGNKAKPFMSGGIEYQIAPRLAVRLFLRYESIVTERGTYLPREINLGGLSLLGGLAFRVF